MLSSSRIDSITSAVLAAPFDSTCLQPISGSGHAPFQNYEQRADLVEIHHRDRRLLTLLAWVCVL
jgi:hypothetical protein